MLATSTPNSPKVQESRCCHNGVTVTVTVNSNCYNDGQGWDTDNTVLSQQVAVSNSMNEHYVQDLDALCRLETSHRLETSALMLPCSGYSCNTIKPLSQLCLVPKG